MAESVKHSTAGYVFLYIVIACLFLLTLSLSFVNLGSWNLILALLIAGTQGALLTLFFMHLREADHITWLIAGAAFFWLAILFVFLLTDYVTRHYGVL